MKNETYDWGPGLPIPAASSLIVNEGKILFIQRAKKPGKGKWGFPGGSLKERETSLQAIKREIKEETGLDIEIKRKLGTYLYLNKNSEYSIDCFLAESRNSKLKLDPREIIDAKWLKPEEGLNLDLTSTSRQVLIDFLNKNKEKGEP